MKSLRLRPFLTLAHWLAIGLLVASTWSGVNLAIDQRPWLKDLLPYWPGISAPSLIHLWTALAWLSLILLYLLHRQQVSEPAAKSPMRQHHRSVQALYAVCVGLAGSGLLMAFDALANYTYYLRALHLLCLALLLLALVWHLLSQWQIGRWSRLLQVFKMSTQQLARLPRSLAILLLLLGAGGVGLQYWQTAHTITAARITGEMRIDGLADETQWRNAQALLLNTYYGAPYQRTVPVEIKMLHDGYSLYVFAKWPDPTHSKEHLPLVKTADGWQVKQSAFLRADEQTFYEDKFAVMLGNDAWDALRSVFLSSKIGRGGHVMPAGQMVDVWHWKSVRNHHFGNLDDAFFGPLLPAIPGQRRYTWGYASDPILAGGFKENWTWFHEGKVTPLRWPRNSEDMAAWQTTPSNPNPLLAMDWHSSQPYSEKLDQAPIGSILPSVVAMHPNEGNRADVRATGVWKDGYWHLEMARSFDTASSAETDIGKRFDQKIQDGVFFWFATFDHSQVRHTYHLRPLRLQLAP